MKNFSFELPTIAWTKVWRWSIGITLVSMAGSVLLTAVLMRALSHDMTLEAFLCSALMPLVLGGPLMFFLVLREQQLRAANQQLKVLASTDGLTSCLNRTAFTTSVTHYLTWVAEDGELAYGAFLVIDADDFKAINDHFGHDRGDEALQAIAGAIRENVRPRDLVGRIGGEEFGVFLPEVGYGDALVIAERIRVAINDLSFAPDGDQHRLSVSIGGAVFKHPAPFAALYRKADELLYKAKQSGRDRVYLEASVPVVAG